MNTEILSQSSHIVSSPDTVTELVLTIDNPLLIVLSPWRRENAWWRDRHGLLFLRHDGVISWHSDHSADSTKITSHEAFKQMIRDGWDVFLADRGEADRAWYEPDLNEWTYESDRIIIRVSPCKFRLGGGSKHSAK
jgi:hypothetical protein